MLLWALAGCGDEARIPLGDAPVEEVPGGGASPCEGVADFQLFEVVSANLEGAEDEDGDTSDWVELALAGQGASLAGWSIAAGDADRWAFPDVTVAPDERLVLWASGKDRADADAPLHAAFAVDALGEALVLYGPGGCEADAVDVPRLWKDQAWGRRDDDGTWAYFLEPTPGAANTTESRPGFAPTPTFSEAAGALTSATTLTVSGEGDLRCTTDGSVPTEDSPACEGLAIGAADDPVVWRARAYVDGVWPSRVATGTWWTDPDVLGGGVAVISLVVDPPDLWSDDRGIYAYGPEYEASYPYFGANFWELWERDLHVTLWEPDGAVAFEQDAGLQIAGGYSRAFDQRNFELLARTAYSDPTFAAPVFPDEEIGAYERLYLRNGGDWCSTQLVDATVQALFRDASGRRLEAVDAQAYRPAMVWLNGDFWGVYELKERLDETWIAAHRGADPDALDRVKLGWTHDANWELEQGTWDAFEAMNAYVADHDLAEDAAYETFAAQVDVTNLAAATVAQGWIGNSDWWGNNLRLWRPHEDGGRFRWMVYDFGHGWPDPAYDHLATSVSGDWTGLPLGSALANPEFHDLFVNVHADLLNTTLAGPAAEATVVALADEVRPVMARQRERWCGGATMPAWEAAVDYARAFARDRAGHIDAALLANLGLTGHAGLSLSTEPEGAGTFHLAVVDVAGPFAGTYYAGVPVTVTALPGDGWTFAGWSDASLGNDPTVTVPMDADTTLVARFSAR